MTMLEPDENSFAVRFTGWRRQHLPLPDEVIHRHLHDEEYVIHSDHHQFSDFLAGNRIWLALLGIGGWFSVMVARDELQSVGLYVTAYLAVMGPLLVLAVKRLRSQYTTYAITNLRLLRVSGVFRRDVTYLAWSRVIGATCRQTALERVLGTGVIRIESAPEGSGLRVLSGLRDPLSFYDLMQEMLTALATRAPPSDGPPTRGLTTTIRQRRRQARRTDP